MAVPNRFENAPIAVAIVRSLSPNQFAVRVVVVDPFFFYMNHTHYLHTIVGMTIAPTNCPTSIIQNQNSFPCVPAPKRIQVEIKCPVAPIVTFETLTFSLHHTTTRKFVFFKIYNIKKVHGGPQI